MTSRAPARVTDRWFKSKVALGRGESIRDPGHFWYRVAPWWSSQGRLYLTSERLIWIRQGLPIGPERIEIALDDIATCEMRRPPFNWQNAMMLETPDGRRSWFVPLALVESAEEWVGKVSDALGATKRG